MALSLKISLGVGAVVSLVMIIAGVCVLLIVIPDTLDKKLKESLPPRNGTDSGDRFEKSPVPAYVRFYLFNVTNKDEVNENGTKAEFKEVGPYTFRQDKIKENLFWNETGGYVNYQERTTYSFDQTLTTGTLDDKVNHLNALSIGILLNAFIGLDVTKLPGDFIDTHTVGELLFGGYDAKPYINSTDGDVTNFICITVTGGMEPCLFSLYKDSNSTLSKLYSVSTGQNELKDIGKILTYDGRKVLNVWQKNSTCDIVKGSDGKQFAPGISKEDTVDVFSADVCRTFKFTYENEVVIEQIDALRFTIPPDVFEDPNKNKENMCYCHGKIINNTCPSKSGVFSVETCTRKPIAMSAPHFFLGEQEYRDWFVGLADNKEKHQTFLDIEPLTGTVISAAKRLQVNFMVHKGDAPFLKYVNESMYFPIMWLEEGARIDPDSAAEFRETVTNPYNTGKWATVAVIAVGGVILLFVVFAVFFKRGRL